MARTHPSHRWARVVVPALAAALAVGSYGSPGGAAPRVDRLSEATLLPDARGPEADDRLEPLTSAERFSAVATAPGTTVSAEAYRAAWARAAQIATVGGSWSEVTNQPYDSDDIRYRDPFISNSGGGAGLVSGRMTGIAVDPRDSRIVYAGAAGGGVWKSTDRGVHWTPVFDDVAANGAVGAVSINPADGSVWVGTGENNTAYENHNGLGVYRSTDGGATWQQVGGHSIDNSTIGKLEFDGIGRVYAATSLGLFRHSASGTSGAWTKLLDAPMFGYDAVPYGFSIVNDVVVRPGTGGQVVFANMAWRNGAAYNGYYLSTDGGNTWAKVDLGGAINPKRIGRAQLAFSADGTRLYTTLEDVVLFNTGVQTGNTVFAGVFSAKGGNPLGPWSKIAGYRKLQQSGSALKLSKGYAPGIQAWYNQFVGVDPANRNHVYVGLEEVFETTNGGSTWHTIGPYWNFGFPCWQVNADSCPKTTHPDQHAVAFGGGYVYVGNDGGIYARRINQDPSSVSGWLDRNATLRTLQYYYAESGIGQANDQHGAGLMVWGGMQDNGASLIAPGLGVMVSPFGGDGGDGIVDPHNGDRTVQEYTSLDMWSTTNGGAAYNYQTNAWTEMTPSCFAFTYTPSPCDTEPQFIAPFDRDVNNVEHWIAGGRYVWDNGGKGWDTACSATSCDWTPVYDTGAGHFVTAVADNGDVTYAGWCGIDPCNPSVTSTTGAGFVNGIATNYGGTWHEVDMTANGLPNRFITGLAVDPSDPAHVVASFGGFFRQWIPEGGVGHVFETWDGGGTWTDITGNLPDAPARDVILVGGNVVVGMDVGVFIARDGTTSWNTLGSGLPHSVADDLSVEPNGHTILVATHGRGIWSIDLPS
jgi:hypothetical protein